MKLTTWIQMIMLAATTGLVAGCAAVVVGGAAAAGTYAYVKGALKSYESVTLDRACQAVPPGLQDIQYTIKNQSRTATEAKYEVESPGGVNASVTLKKEGDTITQFVIRVGTFGDKIESERILKHIKARL